MPGRRCRLLSLWEMVGDISEPKRSPGCRARGWRLDQASPGSQAGSLDQGRGGSTPGGRTPRDWSLFCSREPDPRQVAQAKPESLPTGATSGSREELPVQPRRARGWRSVPWRCDGVWLLTAAGLERLSARPPARPSTCHQVSADTAAGTLLSRHQR